MRAKSIIGISAGVIISGVFMIEMLVGVWNFRRYIQKQIESIIESDDIWKEYYRATELISCLPVYSKTKILRELNAIMIESGVGSTELIYSV